jgi:hypothetical protein
MVTQMAKYLDTVYVSGWQSSSTASASDEPGPDLADYPYVRYLPEIVTIIEITTSLMPGALFVHRPPFPTRFLTCSWLSCSTIENSDKSVLALLNPNERD